MDNMTVESFVGLERQVWEALARGDAKADLRLLSEDFLGVYPSGFADRSEHAGHLIDGPTVAEYTMTEAQIRVLGNDNVLLSYRADWRRFCAATDVEPETMYVTSL